MTLENDINRLKSLLDLEISGYIEITGETLDRLKSLLGISHDPFPCYYNGSNIILSHAEDYMALKSRVKGLEDILKIEMTELTIFYFLGRYINCRELSYVLSRDHQDQTVS